MNTSSNINSGELEEILSRLKQNLTEVEEERMFVLSQTGLHVPGETVRKYEIEVCDLKTRIEETEKALQDKKAEKVIFVGRYVCTCMKVTLKDLEEEIHNGARTFKDIHLKTHCGAKCGACIDNIKKIVQDTVDQK